MMGFYFDRLSLDGADDFLRNISDETDSDTLDEVGDEDAVVDYKILKIFGTERQMRQLMT